MENDMETGIMQRMMGIRISSTEGTTRIHVYWGPMFIDIPNHVLLAIAKEEQK